MMQRSLLAFEPFLVVLFWLLLRLQPVACFNASATPRDKGEADVILPWQLWGPYRPNLYFGVRPQVPDTILMGLMWASGQDRDRMMKTIRYTCEQNDGIEGFGWNTYDPRVGGSQVVHDEELQIDLATDFIKSEGGEWVVRVSGTPRPGAPANLRTTIVFNLASENGNMLDGPNKINCETAPAKGKDQGIESICYGLSWALGGEYFVKLKSVEGNTVLHDAAIVSLQVEEEKIWQAKNILLNEIKGAQGNSVMLNFSPGAGNMHFFQMTFEGAFQAGLIFQLRVNDHKWNFTTDLSKHQAEFPGKVDKIFPRNSSYGDVKYSGFAQSILSNLLGGLGFFHGDTKVDLSHAPEYDETALEFWKAAGKARDRADITTTEPKSLLSFVPSRPVFPRGFLWDEGFHLLPVVEWDIDLAITVLRSWLHQMDEDGWIAREQILGPEARSKVPKPFQVQYPHYANPPTLLSLVVPAIVSKLTGASAYAGDVSAWMYSEDTKLKLMKEIYPLLARHYQWFRRTQAGNFSDAYPRPDGAVAGEGYRWRGRTPQHTLTSGLDDYPRADPPHPGELHLDALAWVGASARALQQVAEYMGETADAQAYGKQVADVKKNIDVLHWSSDKNTYCDATVVDGRYEHVCYKGYVSLFPLFTGLMEAEDEKLSAVLDLMEDPAELWSPHGLRSLSISDPGYGKGDDYWRGAVWMNLNVLAVLRLRDIGLGPGNDSVEERKPVQTRALRVAGRLRNNIVSTVYDSWEKTGFLWEQYSDKTGKGQRSRAFTGWTATVILLLGMEFGGVNLDDDAVVSHGTVWTTAGAAGAFAVLVVLAGVVFRRRLVAWAVPLRDRFQAWLSKRRRGPAYEQVVDLDEQGVR